MSDQPFVGRIEALNADVARLSKALQEIADAKDHDAPSEYNKGWNAGRFRLREIAREALSFLSGE